MRSNLTVFLCIVLGAFLLIAFNCSSRQPPLVTDLIPLVNLQAGQKTEIIISDLFYAADYDLEFKPHSNIRLEYDRHSGRLCLTPASDFEGVALVEAILYNQPIIIPSRTRINPEHSFDFSPPENAQSVTVFGSFNSWNRHATAMTDDDGDGSYTVSLPMEAGRYEYRFYVDGKEYVDPENSKKIPNPFGEYNSLLTIPARHPEKLHLHILKQVQEKECTMYEFAFTADGRSTSVTKGQIIALLDNQIIPDENISIEGHLIRITIPIVRSGIIRCAVTKDGNVSFFQKINIESGRVGQHFSWNDAIIYSIMIDRFNDGDESNTQALNHPELSEQANYHGGDLQGIIDKLDKGYFTDLGINTLWLFPVNDNPDQPYREFPEPHRWFTGYHGYWPVHPTKVEPRFGDMVLFKALVDKAHSKGIKVLLDFVSNHVHQDHPYFKEHPEWFGTLDLSDGRKNIRFWDEYRLTTWFDTFLPSFDYIGSNEALEAMTDNAVWWMKETGIDGFRQDAVKHVPHTFWRTLTRKVRREIEIPEGRETFQIGETFGGYDLISSYVNNGQLDAQFNFQIYDVGQYVFLTPEASFAALDAEMHKTFDVYTMHHLMGNLMDSHDKVRYMAQADGDVPLGDPTAVEKAWSVNRPEVDHASSYEKAKLYLAFVLTIPGVPVIYYGDEIGLTGAADPDNRRPMRFGDALKPIEKQMKADVSRIIRLRRNHSALNHGDFVTLYYDENIYAYMRSDIHERLLIVLNKSEREQVVRLQLPDVYDLSAAIGLLDEGTADIQRGRLRVKMSAIGAAIYQLK
ncbi:hypothetical protein KAR48_16280 [bacterium]|nr:hypothetical protein [bacterium]